MCLAIPGKVVELVRENGLLMGAIDFGGVLKKACLEYLPDVKPGEYVVVHVGFALSKVDEAEASRLVAFLSELGETGAADEIPG